MKSVALSVVTGLALLSISALPSKAVDISPFQASVLIASPGAHFSDGPLAAGTYAADFFFNIGSSPAFLKASASVTDSSFILSPLTLTLYSDPLKNTAPGSVPGNYADDIQLATASSSGGFSGFLSAILAASSNYYVRVSGNAATAGALVDGNISLSNVPVPGAISLFASGLIGLFVLGRRRKPKLQLS